MKDQDVSLSSVLADTGIWAADGQDGMSSSQVVRMAIQRAYTKAELKQMQ